MKTQLDKKNLKANEAPKLSSTTNLNRMATKVKNKCLIFIEEFYFECEGWQK